MAAGQARSRPPPRRILLALAAVSALGSAAIHMLVPALPSLSGDLGVAPPAAQYTISLYLFGLAAGQLLGGPLADRAGRRPVLIAGVALYVAGAAGGAWADSFAALCAARVVQALGAGAGLVGARVIVGDFYDKSEAGRGQARLMGVVLVSTAIAPGIGGYIATTFGWRAVLATQSALALAVCLIIWRSLPETLAPAERSASHVVTHYARLLRNRSFQRTAVAVALCSSALYMFLAVSPFILIDQWGENASDVGLYLSMMAVSAIAGTFMVGRLERRFNAFRLGLAVALAGALLATAAALLTEGHWAALMVPAMIVTLGVGIAGPSGTARILHCEHGLAGTASSLSGALQMSTGGLAAALLGTLAAPSFLVLALVMSAVIGTAWLAAPK